MIASHAERPIYLCSLWLFGHLPLMYKGGLEVQPYEGRNHQFGDYAPEGGSQLSIHKPTTLDLSLWVPRPIPILFPQLLRVHPLAQGTYRM